MQLIIKIILSLVMVVPSAMLIRLVIGMALIFQKKLDWSLGITGCIPLILVVIGLLPLL